MFSYCFIFICYFRTVLDQPELLLEPDLNNSQPETFKVVLVELLLNSVFHQLFLDNLKWLLKDLRYGNNAVMYIVLLFRLVAD